MSEIEGLETESAIARAFARDVSIAGMYIGSTLQQRLDLIEHLIEFGRQIIVLNGGQDSGKSTLLDYFSAGQRSSWVPVRVQGAPGLNIPMLTSALLDELDIEHDREALEAAQQQLRLRIASLERAGKVVVLMIDDAEQLLPETTAFIVSLAHADDQFAELRVLLAADLDRSALLDSLQRAHPQHGLVHVVEIPKLVENQVQPLIEQRMHAVGLNAGEFFSSNDYARMAAEADGQVGKVVTLGRQHLAGASTTKTLGKRGSRQGASPALPRRAFNGVFWILAVAAIAGGAWWATRNPIAPSVTTTEQIELEPTPSTTPAPNTDANPVPQGDAVNGPAPLASEPAPVPPGVNDAGADEVTETLPPPNASLPPPVPVPFSTPMPDPVTSAAPPTATVVAEAPAPLPPTIVGPVEPPTPVPPMASLPNTETPAKVASAKDPAPSTKEASAPVPKALSRASQTASPATKPAPKPVAKPTPPKPAATSETAATIKGFSADWLLKQPASGHTLQLFGVRERAAAERFRAQRGISAQSAVLTSSLNGKPLYLVVYGFYPTRAAAVAALGKLPAPLKGTKPWARSLGSLRDAMR